ncbi:hypothetical protein EG68_01933 [Paragonimus skrjabini miyazakii]|uniref:Gluconokinase n=1 Tax=Paragonimus skrjabini miyazakii TaxID=59628 RepID=A0A8S9Z0B7_9TREM|nr:hypothetical protein EG68_01933 [Paragonimus skrjabini miyazakii]
MIIALIGPSGCGKTTVGSALAQRLHYPFIDADDYHSEGNRTKMARGSPLTDTDRMPWLSLIHSKLNEYPKAVLACSALKRNYRQILIQGLEPTCHINEILFILLQAETGILAQRVVQRQSHFMPVSLLQSQLQTLESFDENEKAYIVDAHRPVPEVLDDILKLVTEMQ